MSAPPWGRGGAQWLPGAARVVAKLECEAFSLQAARPAFLAGWTERSNPAAAGSWKCQAPGRCEQRIDVRSALWLSRPGADKGALVEWESSFWRWSRNGISEVALPLTSSANL